MHKINGLKNKCWVNKQYQEGGKNMVKFIGIILCFLLGIATGIIIDQDVDPVKCNQTTEIVEKLVYHQSNYCSHEMIVEGCYKLLDDAETLKLMIGGIE